MSIYSKIKKKLGAVSSKSPKKKAKSSVVPTTAADDFFVDILDRDDTSFVYFDEKRKLLDWEKFCKDDALCSMMLRGTYIRDDEDALKKALSIVKSFRITLMIPRSIRLRISENESFTDGERMIACSTAPLVEKRLTYPQRIDIFIGEYIHEAAHVKYTNFPMMKARLESFTKDNPEGYGMLYKMLHNVVEDEYIERNIGVEYPGYAGYLAKLKTYAFGTCYADSMELFKKAVDDDGAERELSEKEITEKLAARDKITRLFNLLFSIIRFPKNILASDVAEFPAFVESVKEILKDYPTDTVQSLDKAKELYDLFVSSVEKELEDMREEMKATGEGEGDESDEDSESGMYGGGGDKGKGKGKDKESSDGEKKKKREPLTFAEKAAAREFAKRMLEMFGESMKEIAASGEEELARAAASGGSIELDEEEATEMVDREYFELPENYEYGTTKATKFIRAKDNVVKYNKYKTKIGTKHRLIAQLLEREHRDYKLVLKGMRSGYLDTGKLAEARQNVQTIYEQFAMVKSGQISLCILIDQSGSMHSAYSYGEREDSDPFDFFGTRSRRSSGGEYTTRIDAAAQTAIMIKEALKNNRDVNLYIYGFTSDEDGDGTNQIFVYNEPGHTPKFALGSLKARSQNRDGDCIYETAKRVRKFTDQPVIMAVISDGEPCASGYSGYNHTKLMVERVEKMNFEVMQIAISNEVASGKMFKHWVKFVGMKELPVAICNVLKKLIRRKIKAKVHL